MDDDVLSDFSELRTIPQMLSTRSGAKKGDNRTDLDLLSPGQYSVKSRLSFASHVWQRTSVLYQHCRTSQRVSSQAQAR
ncbi:hypothetical protein KCU67_g19, partial [Aureobasidium melanogenum]